MFVRESETWICVRKLTVFMFESVHLSLQLRVGGDDDEVFEPQTPMDLT